MMAACLRVEKGPGLGICGRLVGQGRERGAWSPGVPGALRLGASGHQGRTRPSERMRGHIGVTSALTLKACRHVCHVSAERPSRAVSALG